jgi:hypothetical protein
MPLAPVDASPTASLWRLIARGGSLSERLLHGARSSVILASLLDGSSLDQPLHAFAGRSVLVATEDQLTAALAMIELDGIARRLVLCPPGTATEHLPIIAETAEIELVVTDTAARLPALPAAIGFVSCNSAIAPAPVRPDDRQRTEWILLTSGTTGVPKLVVHTLYSLVGAIKPNSDTPIDRGVWSTFYDIRRYGGMQIFFRGLLGGGSLVLSSAQETVADFLTRAGALGVTQISGTPTHWRRALMSPAAGRIAPRYVRMSGEIADQAIIDDLKAAYGDAGVAHAFATTEAGVGFAVNDELAGFPADLLDRLGAEVEMKISDGSLHIRSARTASRYLGVTAGPLLDADGFVDTGDMIERRGERYYFSGRRGGIINVGGLKVHPEEVEAVLNRHPRSRCRWSERTRIRSPALSSSPRSCCGRNSATASRARCNATSLAPADAIWRRTRCRPRCALSLRWIWAPPASLPGAVPDIQQPRPRHPSDVARLPDVSVAHPRIFSYSRTKSPTVSGNLSSAMVSNGSTPRVSSSRATMMAKQSESSPDSNSINPSETVANTLSCSRATCSNSKRIVDLTDIDPASIHQGWASRLGLLTPRRRRVFIKPREQSRTG